MLISLPSQQVKCQSSQSGGLLKTLKSVCSGCWRLIIKLQRYSFIFSPIIYYSEHVLCLLLCWDKCYIVASYFFWMHSVGGDSCVITKRSWNFTTTYSARWRCKTIGKQREVKEQFHTWEVIECFKADSALEGKASLLCLIHCPSPVKSPPVKEAELQLTLHPLCPPACVPSGAARHLKLALLLLTFVVWHWDKGDFEWDCIVPYTGKLSGTKGRSRGEGHFCKCSQTHQKQVPYWFPTCPINFGFTFPFRLFRSFLLYRCFL